MPPSLLSSFFSRDARHPETYIMLLNILGQIGDQELKLYYLHFLHGAGKLVSLLKKDGKVDEKKINGLRVHFEEDLPFEADPQIVSSLKLLEEKIEFNESNQSDAFSMVELNQKVGKHTGEYIIVLSFLYFYYGQDLLQNIVFSREGEVIQEHVWFLKFLMGPGQECRVDQLLCYLGLKESTTECISGQNSILPIFPNNHQFEQPPYNPEAYEDKTPSAPPMLLSEQSLMPSKDIDLKDYITRFQSLNEKLKFLSTYEFASAYASICEPKYAYRYIHKFLFEYRATQSVSNLLQELVDTESWCEVTFTDITAKFICTQVPKGFFSKLLPEQQQLFLYYAFLHYQTWPCYFKENWTVDVLKSFFEGITLSNIYYLIELHKNDDLKLINQPANKLPPAKKEYYIFLRGLREEVLQAKGMKETLIEVLLDPLLSCKQDSMYEVYKKQLVDMCRNSTDYQADASRKNSAPEERTEQLKKVLSVLNLRPINEPTIAENDCLDLLRLINQAFTAIKKSYASEKKSIFKSQNNKKEELLQNLFLSVYMKFHKQKSEALVTARMIMKFMEQPYPISEVASVSSASALPVETVVMAEPCTSEHDYIVSASASAMYPISNTVNLNPGEGACNKKI